MHKHIFLVVLSFMRFILLLFKTHIFIELCVLIKLCVKKIKGFIYINIDIKRKRKLFNNCR